MASISAVAEPSSPMEASRNWLEIPDELMVDIFQRLRTAEIIASSRVCTTWQRICKNPDLWKVIDVQEMFDGWRGYCYRLTKQAVNLSCGELIDISVKGFCTDGLLDHIVLRSSKLNGLSLKNCYNISIKGLSRALKRAPQLEKLHITYTSWVAYDIKDIVRNCPQLKSFKLDIACIEKGIKNDKDALAIAKNMPKLRHLQLFGNAMTNRGLKAILDGCPHLESLDISTCYNINNYGNEVKLHLERIKTFKAPQDSNENRGFDPRIPEYMESYDSHYFYEYDPTVDDHDDHDDHDGYINYMMDDFTL